MSHTYDFELEDSDEVLELELEHEPVSSYRNDDVRAERLPNGHILVGYLTYDEGCPNPLTDSDGMGDIIDAKHRESEWREALGIDRDGHQFNQMDIIEEMVRELDDKDVPDIIRPMYPPKKVAGREVPYAHPPEPNWWDRTLTRDDLKLGYRKRFDELMEWHKKNGSFGDPDRVMLSVYEHSGIAYSVMGEAGYPFTDPWDTSPGRAVWVPDKVLRVNEAAGLTGDERRAKMREWAGQACETFTDWANGSCYCVVIELFDADGEQLESDLCGGYVGWKWAEEQLESDLKYWREHPKETA